MTAVSPATTSPQEIRLFAVIPAVLLLALAALVQLRTDVAADMAVQVFVVLYLVMAAIDITAYKVPNLIVYPAIMFALLATAVIDPGLGFDALAGAGVALVIMLGLAILSRGAMGMGDVKVACFSGCVLGLQGGIFSLLFGFAIGAAVALPVLLLGLRSRKQKVPLTPFLAAGAIFYGFYFQFLVTSAPFQ